MSTEQTTTSDVPAAKDAKKTAVVREYIVLAKMDAAEGGAGTRWLELGTAKGKTADEAEAKIVDALFADEQGGPFVTIAMRNWQPTEYALDEIPATVVRRRK